MTNYEKIKALIIEDILDATDDVCTYSELDTYFTTLKQQVAELLDLVG